MSRPLVSLQDRKSGCLSIMATVPLAAYLDLVDTAYFDAGGIEGQRTPIRSKTGVKIRSRLVDDIKKGAVIPPIVIGVICSEHDYEDLEKIDESMNIINAIKDRNLDVSIIDGMQRTTALLESGIAHEPDSEIRVEIWLSHKVESLIYRMLVLNTGQVPWDLKRQLDTLYRPLLKKVQVALPGARIIALEETSRRSGAGDYKSTRIVELFLAFTSRSIDVDIKDKIAEEFARVDITEAAANDEYFPLFVDSLKLMINLDQQFDRIGRNIIERDESTRIKAGRDIFTSAPASIGFIVAVAERLFGGPGFDYTIEAAQRELIKVSETLNSVVRHMEQLEEPLLLDFLDFDTLNRVLSTGKTSRIGEQERNRYKKAFETLIDHSERIIAQGSMAPCWLAR